MRSNLTRLVRMLTLGFAVAVMASCIPAVRSVGFSVSYVQVAPPPRRVEYVTARPGPGFVWIDGFWLHEYNRYSWVPGHWERTPRGKKHWKSGRWRRHDRGWYWVPGYWR